MPVYYKKIKGKNYDKKIIDLAEKSVAGKGDGRISIKDARKILKSVKDSNSYTDIEKLTMRYIRDHYKFTPESDKWFRDQIRKWAAAKKTEPAAKPWKKGPPEVIHRKDEKVESFIKIDEKRGVNTVGEKPAQAISNKVYIGIVLFLLLFLVVYNFGPGIKSYFTGDKSPADKSDTGIVNKEQVPAQTERNALNQAPGDRIKISDKTVNFPVKEDLIKKSAVDNKNNYTVTAGDQLTEISNKIYGNHTHWKKIFEANKSIIKDPTLIYPGQKLIIPEIEKK